MDAALAAASLVPDGFPVATKTGTATIGGEPTQLVRCAFADATLLIATQTGTVGTVLQARQDATFEGKATYSTSVLVGKRDEPLLAVAARQLVEAAAEAAAQRAQQHQHQHGGGGGSGAPAAGGVPPLLCCLALKTHTPEAVRELLDAVRAHGLL